MPTSITTHFVNSYEKDVFLNAQQRESRLARAVTIKTGVKGERSFVNQLGAIDPSQITDRGGDSPMHDLDHDRSMITFNEWEIGLLVDEPDIFKADYDPTNKYSVAAKAGFGRQIDRTIRDFLEGTRYSGVNGATSNTLGSGNKVAVDYVEVGSAANSGLTVGKMRRTAQILNEFEIPSDDGKRFLALSGQQVTDLLRDSEVTSSDYNMIQGTLTRGEVPFFMGFNIIRTELLSLNASTDVRKALAWHKDWAHLHFQMNMKVRLGEHPGKRYNPYFYTAMGLGGTRLEEDGVVEISCDESP